MKRRHHVNAGAAVVTIANNKDKNASNVVQKAQQSQALRESVHEELIGDDIYIREMKLQDCAYCTHLSEAAFSNKAAISRYFIDNYCIVGFYVENRDCCFVAEKKQKDGTRTIIGFIVSWCSVAFRERTYANLEWIVVDQEHRRKGIGTQLLARCEKQLRSKGANSIVAAISRTNTSTIQFVQKLQFKSPVAHVFLCLKCDEFVQSTTQVSVGSKRTAEQSNSTSTNSNKEATSSSNKMVKVDNKRSIGNGVRAKLPDFGELIIEPINIDDIYPAFVLGEAVFSSMENLQCTWDEMSVTDAYELNPNTSFVAKFSKFPNEIAGFLLGEIINKHKLNKKFGYLEWLCVNPKFQKRGVGKSLFTKYFNSIVASQEIESVFIDTQADNLGALSFFQKIGFKEVEMLFYYSKSL